MACTSWWIKLGVLAIREQPMRYPFQQWRNLDLSPLLLLLLLLSGRGGIEGERPGLR